MANYPNSISVLERELRDIDQQIEHHGHEQAQLMQRRQEVCQAIHKLKRPQVQVGATAAPSDSEREAKYNAQIREERAAQGQQYFPAGKPLGGVAQS